jgi:hypothetical protein
MSCQTSPSIKDGPSDGWKSVAVDVEQTLAGTHLAMFNLINEEQGTEYTPDQVDTWSWMIEEFGRETFMKYGDRVWQERPSTIAPLGNIRRAIQYIGSEYDTDIVTARTGVEDEMKRWLYRHGVDESMYGEFRSIEPGRTKAELGYGYYLDDKPGLVEMLAPGQHQILISYPYNYHLSYRSSRHTRVLNVEAGASVLAPRYPRHPRNARDPRDPRTEPPY